MSEVARNARQASRFLDELVATGDATSSRARHPARPSTGQAAKPAAACSCRPRLINGELPAGLPQGKADNQILGVVQCATCEAAAEARRRPGVERHQHAHQGARARPGRRGLLQRQGARGHRPALHRHARSCRADFWDKHGKDMESWQQGGHTYYRVRGPLVPTLLVNEFVYLETPGERAVLRAWSRRSAARRAVLQTLQGLHATRRTTSGASPRATASRTSRSTC